jgi:hypothetical protein
MVTVSELEKTVFDGQVQKLFTQFVAELKDDARELEVLGDEIRVLVVRTAGYFSRPISVSPEPLRSVTPK